MSLQGVELQIRSCRLLRGMALLACLLQLSGCMSPAQKFDRIAKRSSLREVAIAGDGFGHRIYRTRSSPQAGGVLLVYLEGDGTPGAEGGTRPSHDPTARQPLALQMMTATRRAGIYLTRPCYNGLSRAPECSSSLWTSARYSEPVVTSMCAALERYVDQTDVGIVLIGFSGGGTLAMLMAHCVRNLRGIITVAANLDIDAWTSLHGYLPLQDSLNPARLNEPPGAVVHYVGERDTNVPPSMLASYFSQRPSALVLRMPEFDHACCWVAQWPALLEAAMSELTKSLALNMASPNPATP
jgi:predicted alpha/beta hydrolase family esterase